MKSRFVRFSPEWWDMMTMPEPNTGCLLWLGCVCKSGYGRVAYRGRASGVLVHRIAYECVHGPILNGRHVCHHCDTPSCVNPDHLFIGTQEDNMRDMFAKGRANPGGRKPRRVDCLRTVSAALAPSELALVNSDERVRIVDPIHPIRSSATIAGWRHVTGVPARRPTQAIVLRQCPHLVTAEPAVVPSPVSNRRDAGAVLRGEP